MLHGRRVGLARVVRISRGLGVSTLAAAFGLAAVGRATVVAITSLKPLDAGGLDLAPRAGIGAGARFLRKCERAGSVPPPRRGRSPWVRSGDAGRPRQSQDCVPFTALLPQFLTSRAASADAFCWRRVRGDDIHLPMRLLRGHGETRPTRRRSRRYERLPTATTPRGHPDPRSRRSASLLTCLPRVPD